MLILLIINILDRYRYIRDLGTGAFGLVFLAHDKIENALVAIKKIDLSILSEKILLSAESEISILKSLNHLNIISFKNSFQENHNLFVITEYINGCDLSKRIEQKHTIGFTEDEILNIFVQICFALDYIHELHIIHRDIKPQNIFLTQLEIVKIGDFGISRDLGDSKDMCSTPIGTPFYLSPEIWNGDPYNYRSDYWSLGCVLYEICCLKRPFEGKSQAHLCNLIMKGNYDAIPNKYSSDIQYIIDSLLCYQPEKRISPKEIIKLPYIQQWMKKSNILLNELHYRQYLISDMIDSRNMKITSESLLPNESLPQWARSEDNDIYECFVEMINRD